MGDITYSTPHNFVKTAYQKYSREYPNNPSINGKIFEYLICETLAREAITPFYYQVRFNRVPNADFDVVLYDPVKPVVLTMKTSLRERYKQADLEGLALRQVYRKAESYLITLSCKESHGVKKKIEDGSVVGLDQCVIASDKEFSTLIKQLHGRGFSEAISVMPLVGKLYPVSTT